MVGIGWKDKVCLFPQTLSLDEVWPPDDGEPDTKAEAMQGHEL